jgi:hypothetical protein
MNTLEHLHKPGHIAPIATFRFLFGLILFFHSISFFFNDAIKTIFEEPNYFFSHSGFEWLIPLPLPWMYVLFGALSVLALMISAGLFFRVSSILFLIIYLYVSNIDKAQAYQFSDFYSLTLFIVLLLPSHRYFSLDILRKPSLRVDYIPRWCSWVLKIQVAMVFFDAGLSKLNTTWLLESQPFLTWVNNYWGNGFLGNIFSIQAVAMFTCWFIVFVEFAGPVAMFFSKTKVKVYIFLSIFLLFSFLLLPTGFLPIQIILLSTIYLSESLHHNVTSRTAYFLNDFLQFNPKVFKSGRNLMLAYKNKLIVPLFFTWMFSILVFSNLSHFITYWKSEDKLKDLRISDKLIINKKEGKLKLYVYDEIDSTMTEIDLDQELTSKQLNAMAVNPSLLLQYSKYLNKKFLASGDENIQINADAFISYNGKSFERFIDPKLNLAAYTGSIEGVIFHASKQAEQAD